MDTPFLIPRLMIFALHTFHLKLTKSAPILSDVERIFVLLQSRRTNLSVAYDDLILVLDKYAHGRRFRYRAFALT